MPVSKLIRSAAAAVVVLAIGACSDAPIQPSTQQHASLPPAASILQDKGPATPPPPPPPKPKPDPKAKVKADAAKNADPGAPLDTAEVTFDNSQGLTATFGANKIVIPPNSVCDLASSGYGTSYWNLPCTLQAGSITIDVVWSTRLGHAYIEFEPELRFSPAQTVLLYLTDKKTIQAMHNDWAILWRDETGAWVNEALTDPSLKTYPAPGGAVYRRIKHFSGYYISAGASQ